MASEPLTWATLFDEDPILVEPRKARVTGLIKSYRYATQNFGAAIAARHTHLTRDEELDGLPGDVAYAVAAQQIIQDCYREGNPERVKEFCMEFPTDDALALLQRYMTYRQSAEHMADSPEGPI